MAGGDELGIGGQEFSRFGPLGRGQQALDGVGSEGSAQFGHEFDDAGTLADGLEELAGIACGAGRLGGAMHRGKELIEDKEIAFLEQVLEAVLDPGHFVQQMLLVAMQGRGAQVVLAAQLGQGGSPVQQGQVDGLTLGVVTDGTWHGDASLAETLVVLSLMSG